MPRKPNTTRDHYYDPFPSALRKLIEDRGLLQNDVTTVLGVKNRQSVTGYIDGSTLPTPDKIVAVAKYFGVSADYLLGLSDDPNVTPDSNAAAEYLGLPDYVTRLLKKTITPLPCKKLFEQMIRGEILRRVLSLTMGTAAEINKCRNALTAENAGIIRKEARHIQRDLGEDIESILGDLTEKNLLNYEIEKIEQINRQRRDLEEAAENYSQRLLELEDINNGEHQTD